MKFNILKAVLPLILAFNLLNAYEITPIAAPDTNFVAGSFWDEEMQCLFFIDFDSPTGVNSIYRYDYKTGQFYGAQIIGETSPSFIIPNYGNNNEYVVGLLGSVAVIIWDGVSATATVSRTLFTVFGHLNYAIADSSGRLYTGTINNTLFCSAQPIFSTYRYAPETGLTQIFANIHMTTGLAINEKKRKFYHANACKFAIYEFDYDPRTGDICNGKLVFDFNLYNVTNPLVLGISLDCDGIMYVGLYETSEVWKIDPRTLTLLERYRFKSRGISGPVFGGPNRDVMLVTAARVLVNPFAAGLLEPKTNDDVLFKVTGLGVKGARAYRTKV